MNEIFYNILWIDDEHEELSGTKARAKRNNLNLIPFKSLNNGISELEINSSFYDGIILDAKFFENEDDVKGSEDTENVHRAKDQILQMNKKFDIFVFTGQAEAYQNDTFAKAFKKIYKKGNNEDTEKLFKDVKLAAQNHTDTQLRHDFKRVFDVCTEKYIGESAKHDLLTLLKITDESDIENNFNTTEVTQREIRENL